MAEQSIWSGKLDASSEQGVKTGVTLNTRDPKITITVTGSAKYAQNKPDFGPIGDSSYQNPNTLLPSANVGAVLMKVGNGPYRVVGNGLPNWTIREDGELTFFYNDWPGKYGDNSGSFDINVARNQNGTNDGGHYDVILNYITGDNTTWTARWVGDIFLHTPAGPNPGGTEHQDTIIIYKMWDDSFWQANWDASTEKFRHVPLPAPNPPSRVEHEDVILNYITWDGSRWTAVRDGDGFYHTPAK
ncbi:LecA/PA-IL family lectin (plasmid) [Phyllobacteriaceae bacterium JZ32]